MTLNEIVTSIIDDHASGFSRTKVLSYVNRAQNFLYKSDCAMTTYLNNSDPSFPIPILSTTAGQLSYNLSSASFVDTDGNALVIGVTPRRVKEVFMQCSVNSASDYNRVFYGEQFSWAGLNDIWARRLYRVAFYRIPVMLRDKTDAAGATITFVEDPGTSTNKYYVEFYKEATQLTSEAIPLSVDGNVWDQALIDGAVGLIEDAENGESRRLEKFQTFWLKQFTRSFNYGMESRKPIEIDTRECG